MGGLIRTHYVCTYTYVYVYTYIRMYIYIHTCESLRPQIIVFEGRGFWITLLLFLNLKLNGHKYKFYTIM